MTLALELADHHLNIQGLAHGGVIATLADAAMGLSLRSALEPGRRHVVGRDRRALPAAGRRAVACRAIGRAVRIGREIAYAEADVARRERAGCWRAPTAPTASTRERS